MSNESLNNAKKAKNDEFYTGLSDIQKEINNYADKFKGKVVFCNCDDPFESNFVKYFLINFNRLELKELIANGYRLNSDEPTYILRVSSTKKYLSEGQEDLDVAGVKYFLNTEGSNSMAPLLDRSAGDFRSDISLRLLQESDIVITNPPFSLFREFVATLMKYEKQFLILGNLFAIGYKDFFPLLKNNKVWFGCNNGSKEYEVPESYAKEKSKNTYKKGDKWYTKLGNTYWYTNINNVKRHTMLPLDLSFTYNGHEDMYPKYDNYDAINVDRVSKIPCDYMDYMGVPVTFLEKHCPEQFEIIDICDDLEYTKEQNKVYPYNRIIIKRIL